MVWTGGVFTAAAAHPPLRFEQLFFIESCYASIP